MRVKRGAIIIMGGATLLFALSPASLAYAASASDVPPTLSIAAGVMALAVSAVLLREMLTLKAVARGAAIADNITYVVLAVLCLVSSVLVGWISRFVPVGFPAEYARLGADFLSVVATVLFIVYFGRVRRVMSRYLDRLVGEQQLLTAALDEGGVSPDA